MTHLEKNRSHWLAAMFVLLLVTSCQSTPETAVRVADEETESADIIDARIWFTAADAGDTETLRALLDDGLDPLVERQGLTALHIAARYGYLDVVALFLEAGVDVNIVPSEREAALAAAAGHGNPQMVEMIAGVELGPEAIANVTNRRSPLNLAVENGHADIAALLLKTGADVNARGEWYSPLHSAILFGDAEIVELLLTNGARLETRIRIHDRTKFSGFRYVRPVELARIIERDDLVELLRRFGGKD